MADDSIDELRVQLTEALGDIPVMRDVLAKDVPGGVLDTILALVEGQALDRMADRLLAETNLRAMDFRNGMSMEIEPARALAANFVGAARAMLCDAPNYSETPLEFSFGLAGKSERFAFIVQRVGAGALTPHEARQAAEAAMSQWKQAHDNRAEQLRAYARWCESREVDPEVRDLVAIADAEDHDDYVALVACGHDPANAREGCVDHMPTPNPDCEACTS